VALALIAYCVQGGAARAEDPDFLGFTLGYFDVNHQRNDALEARIEYRSDKRFWLFKPFGGIMFNNDAALHGYAGVLIDIYFGRRIVLTPSFAPGIYLHGGSKDLGYPLEFRSQIEIAYRFDDFSRLALSFNHISNASLGDHNPGVESLAVSYIIPFNKLFGN